MAYRIEIREVDTETWESYDDYLTVPIFTEIFDASVEAESHVFEGEGRDESRVLDENGNVMYHFFLDREEMVDLTNPPGWISDLKEALVACEHPESMSDADIAEHNLAGVVCQYRDMILGVWNRE